MVFKGEDLVYSRLDICMETLEHCLIYIYYMGRRIACVVIRSRDQFTS
jgi:hypothetical protein